MKEERIEWRGADEGVDSVERDILRKTDSVERSR